MKLGTAVSALTLLSMGAANAAVATYDFEDAPVGAIDTVSFGGALAPLGITSSVITGDSGSPDSVTGVWVNNNGPTPEFGAKSFTIGYNGTWTLIFGGLGIDSFSILYNDTEFAGFTASVYSLDGNTLLQTQNIDGGPGALGTGTLSFGGLGPIGKFTITDVWAADGIHNGGDNVQLDNISVNTIEASGVPEPSTYLMIGSALAGLAALRRHRRS